MITLETRNPPKRPASTLVRVPRPTWEKIQALTKSWNSRTMGETVTFLVDIAVKSNLSPEALAAMVNEIV
jgi:hypothetical protein